MSLIVFGVRSIACAAGSVTFSIVCGDERTGKEHLKRISLLTSAPECIKKGCLQYLILMWNMKYGCD